MLAYEPMLAKTVSKAIQLEMSCSLPGRSTPTSAKTFLIYVWLYNLQKSVYSHGCIADIKNAIGELNCHFSDHKKMFSD